MSIRVHHLEFSRSTRVLWLMEELGLAYELVGYKRDRTTRRADASLLDVHPLGKAPVVEVDGLVIAESGVIIEYLIETLGEGRLAPKAGPARAEYLGWLHYAEGSAMLPIMLNILGRFRGGLSQPIADFTEPETAKALAFISGSIKPQGYLLESGFSGADIQVHYVVAAARWLDLLGDDPNVTAYLDRLETRPAYRKAIEIGGPLFPPLR